MNDGCRQTVHIWGIIYLVQQRDDWQISTSRLFVHLLSRIGSWNEARQVERLDYFLGLQMASLNQLLDGGPEPESQCSQPLFRMTAAKQPLASSLVVIRPPLGQTTSVAFAVVEKTG